MADSCCASTWARAAATGFMDVPVSPQVPRCGSGFPNSYMAPNTERAHGDFFGPGPPQNTVAIAAPRKLLGSYNLVGGKNMRWGFGRTKSTPLRTDQTQAIAGSSAGSPAGCGPTSLQVRVRLAVF